MKLRIKSMIWNIRNQKTTNQNKKKKESKKNEIIWTASGLFNFKRSNSCLLEVPEGEEKYQGIGNLYEKIVKENFPDLVKEIDMQVREVQSPNYGCKEAPSNTHYY